MKNLIQFGLENSVFTPESVMTLLYGGVRYKRHVVVATQQHEDFCEWNAYPRSTGNWGVVPLTWRREIIEQILHKIKEDYSDYDCFHLRILCFLHFMLDDEENRIECILQYPWGKDTSQERKYSTFCTEEQERLATFEVFLWFKSGIQKTKSERKLLRQCWQKFLGCDRIKSQKQMTELAEKKVQELQTTFRKAQRKVNYNNALINRYREEKNAIKKRHLSRIKRELLIQQLEEKDTAAHQRFWHGQRELRRCTTALNFLNGYLDYVKLS